MSTTTKTQTTTQSPSNEMARMVGNAGPFYWSASLGRYMLRATGTK